MQTDAALVVSWYMRKDEQIEKYAIVEFTGTPVSQTVGFLSSPGIVRKLEAWDQISSGVVEG